MRKPWLFLGAAAMLAAGIFHACVSAPLSPSRPTTSPNRDAASVASTSAAVADVSTASSASSAVACADSRAQAANNVGQRADQPAAVTTSDSPQVAWMRRVAKFNGWEGELKANPGRVRIHGIYWTETEIIVAVPHQAKTVDGEPTVKAVRLEFERLSMQRWKLPTEVAGLDGIDFWSWKGDPAPKRFTFSFRFESEVSSAWG